MNLHSGIMNIIEKRSDMQFMHDGDRILYKEGHRDARHAAAELALKADARIEELKDKLSKILSLANGLSVLYDNPLSAFDKGYTMCAERIYKEVLKIMEEAK